MRLLLTQNHRFEIFDERYLHPKSRFSKAAEQELALVALSEVLESSTDGTQIAATRPQPSERA